MQSIFATMNLTGKGYFIENILDCEGGDSQIIANQAKKADLSHVIIKVAHRANSSNIDKSLGVDYAQRTIQTLKAAGIQTWGWQFISGDNPLAEARKAIQRVEKLNLNGFVINAEDEYKMQEKDAAASQYMTSLRTAFPNLPLALSSYRFPSYHPQIPWKEFLNKCDFNMPKLFWVQSHNPFEQLARSVNEFESLKPYRPVIPTGGIFSTDKWQPSTHEILAFLEGAVELNLSAANFWLWDTARSSKLQDLWFVTKNFSWPPTNTSAYITKAYFSALNNKDSERIAELYDQRSVHVTSNHTIQGISAIKNWYTRFFNNTPSSINFINTTTSGEGNSLHFTWKATTQKSSNDKDTPVSRSPKISLNEFSELFQGIFHRKQIKAFPRKHTLHTVIIDLDNPDIDLMVTPRSGLGRTTSSFLRKYNLQLAINGDEWLALNDPKGLAVAAGDQYSPPSPEPTAFISKLNQVQIGGTPPKSIWDAISGSHTIVRDGQISKKIRTCEKPDIYCQHLAPRTSIGVTPENYLIIIIVEGPPNSLREALTLKELAALFVNLGAHSAINLDGGGSSTLVVENNGGSKTLNTPTDGSERAVANHLGIYAKKLDTIDIITDGNDTLGLLNDKIVYHLTLFTKT
ncbi:MAG: phosphodiester glycosidase family protein [Chloroflexota bacterium]